VGNASYSAGARLALRGGASCISSNCCGPANPKLLAFANKTCRIVARCQARSPWAVGTDSEFTASAMAARVFPSARYDWMRRIMPVGGVLGRPSWTPSAFLTASASRVRAPMIRRSYWAKVAISDADHLPDGSGGVNPGVQNS